MLKGNIQKELIRPATQGMRSNGRKKSVRIPYSLIDMERNIREIADVTRTDNPFDDKRRGNVICRKRMAVV
jgi:hypothetical protein